MKIPFNDPSRMFSKHRKDLERIFAAAGESGKWVLGDENEKFSREFAAYCGASYCLPAASGTDALELALRAALGDFAPEDPPEVITAANAGGYTTAACRIIGAVPVYADIVRESGLIDLESLKSCLGPKVKAVVLTHLYGGAVDVPAVRDMLAREGYGHVSIIEDCAQAHGAKARGMRAGGLGDLSAFSFYPTKNLAAMGDAGAVLTSNQALFERAKALSQYGWKRKYETVVPGGRNSRMDELQAAVLRYFLPYLDEWNAKRKTIYTRYKKSAGAGLLPLDHAGGDYAAHLAVFRAREREKFMRFMEERGIGVSIHYPVLDSDQPGWAALPSRIDPLRGLAHSREAARTAVSLPCFPFLSAEELDYICSVLEDWNRT